ncbi:MAG: CDP-diacylglycerol--serine O-phosphatidyltransferase [Proteobacteria bacterium]|nr:CDP-diacylglycerol--serine O-phosphatidyltransferase [Pseudomonadota bacterium]
MKKNYFASGKKTIHKKNFRRGIYLLPNLFTTCSLFCGFYSIVASFNGDFTRAAWAIIFSAVFDWLDGKIARVSHSSSRFGMEYDSLSDLIAFGAAPAVMIYAWALMPFGRIGWLAAFLFVACAALRLARFNINSTTIEMRFFQGMPTPAAGGILATTIIISNYLGLNEIYKPVPILFLTFFLSLMMVSKVRYYGLKQLGLTGEKSFQTLVITLCVIIIIAAEPQITLFTLGLLYALSGPVLEVKEKVKAIKNKDLLKEKEEEEKKIKV